MKKILVIVGVAILAVASIGGYVFAQGMDQGRLNYGQERAAIEESVPRRNSNHCGNSEEMVEIMKENGYEDMVQWMEVGDFESMKEFMNNLTDEDYEKMIGLMDQNGYGNMARMMESMKKEGMINMHNSMMNSNASNFNMMGNMMNRF